MMTFFLILIVLGGLALWISSKGANMMPSRCDINPDDKKHHWVIRFNNEDRRGHLVCKTCGKLPGEE